MRNGRLIDLLKSHFFFPPHRQHRDANNECACAIYGILHHKFSSRYSLFIRKYINTTDPSHLFANAQKPNFCLNGKRNKRHATAATIGRNIIVAGSICRRWRLTIENIVNKLTLNCWMNCFHSGELRRDRFFSLSLEWAQNIIFVRMHNCNRDKIGCEFVTCARAQASLIQWPLSENSEGALSISICDVPNSPWRSWIE